MKIRAKMSDFSLIFNVILTCFGPQNTSKTFKPDSAENQIFGPSETPIIRCRPPRTPPKTCHIGNLPRDPPKPLQNPSKPLKTPPQDPRTPVFCKTGSN